MNGHKKQENTPDMCKNHSARSDRELYRVCPSKLSKRELEDLYYTLLENNLELKKAGNSQQEKIKLLSTKVQRMTAAQKNTVAKEQKDCCAHTKALVNEHKDSMLDLKKENERMAERIRVLNMRLCSAKQFLRRNSAGAASRNVKTSAPNGVSAKNSALSVLNTDFNLRASVSSQCLVKDPAMSARTVETNTDENEKEPPQKLCDENKCRTLMEELKQKVADLQEELSKTHADYSERITRLEQEVSKLHGENCCMRHAAQQRDQRAGDLAARLHDATAQKAELATELAIEKRRVSELETRAKAVDMSHAVNTVKEHLSNTNQLKAELEDQHFEKKDSPYFMPMWVSSPNRPSTSVRSQFSPARENKLSDDSGYTDPSGSQPTPPNPALDKPSTSVRSQFSPARENKLSDDSGYTDPNGSQPTPPSPALDKDLNTMNKELMDRIAYLQGQMAILKSSALSIKSTAIPVGAGEPPPTAKPASTTVPEHCPPGLLELRTSEINYFSTKPMAVPDVVLNDVEDHKTNLALDTNDERAERQQAQELLADERAPALARVDPDAVSGVTVHSRKMLEHEPDDHEITHDTKKHYAQSKTRYDVDSDLGDEGPRKNLGSAHSYVPHLLPASRDPTALRAPSKRDQNITTKIKKLIDHKRKHDRKKKVSAELNQGIDILDHMPQSFDAATSNRDDIFIKCDATSITNPHVDNMSVEKSTLTGYDVERRRSVNGAVESGVVLVQSPTDAGEAMRAPQRDAATESGDVMEGDSEFELCEQYACACTCPAAARREVVVFRTCSGTLRFRTTAAAAGCGVRFRQCACLAKPNEEPKRDACGTQTEEPRAEEPAARSAASGPGNTYAVPGPRAASPANTDLDLSSLTDLPSERDGKSPRTPLSPGEDKATSTYTNSYTPTTDYGTLSEGELPAAGKEPKRSSNPETKVNFAKRTSLSSSTQRMEEALQAISDELARCRQLLLAPQRAAPAKCDVSLTAEMDAGAPLRRKFGSPSISDAFSPKCIFTVHIGTVVLSDEAVISSRGMSMVLTWKFYDQNVAMARLRSDRVMFVDFSTEYDVKITPQFLDYLKYEQMAIVICEVDKRAQPCASCAQPFASCALPLRDALLHTNRRSDMSLALTAGPQLRKARELQATTSGRDARNSGDEVGVLDLWCMLRVDPALLPDVNRAIVKANTPPTSTAKNIDGGGSSTGLLEQLLEDDPSNEYWLSQDKDMAFSKRHKKISLYNPNSDARPDTTSVASQSAFSMTNNPHKKEPAQAHHKTQMSTIIENVPNTTTDGIKDSLVPNTEQNEMPPYSRMKKTDDIKRKTGFVKNDSWEKLNRSLSNIYSPQPSLEIDEPPELNKNQIGSYRAYDTSKKSVTIAMNNENENVTSQRAEGGPRQRSSERLRQAIEITVLWLALSEECDAMNNPRVQRLYVAYNFLGRRGAELETPVSLPKPSTYSEKCYFNFSKVLYLNDCDLPQIGHMAKCKSSAKSVHNSKDCIVFTVISEPPEDPLGLQNCEDIGYAYLYFGDLLAYSAGNNNYTEVLPVTSATAGDSVTGVLAVKVDGLDVVRRALLLTMPRRELSPDTNPPDTYKSSKQTST